MIRIAYVTSPPSAPMQQFRARLELAARRTRRSLEQRRRSLRSDNSRAMIMADTGINDYFGRRWRQELMQTRAAYENFFHSYDTLVGLLCLAAHEGLKPEHEAEYRMLRAWFEAHYPALKPRVAAFLTSDESEVAADKASTPRWSARARTRPCDAFESLYFPKSVAALLESDSGGLIGRMMRTQDALAAWDRSLRREEAAIALSPAHPS